ncbi:MAG: MotA/TolQ/ExbB proton channel family protein [Bacteroidia bacterium]|nr:MotA/TolQ/ExbB proton channel family protein [Bacteroidia bacterium]
MSLLFLQVDSLATAPKEVSVSLFDLVILGGWFMIPIAMLLAWGIYVFIERYLTIRKVNQSPDAFMKQITSFVRGGSLDKAINLCEITDTPFARMVLKGISRLGQPLSEISASIETEAKLEVYRMEKHLSILATVSGAAPMLGFLGTVTGMISAFMQIATLEGNVSPSDLAGGIYEAMLTTAAGLIVGIPAYIGFNFLTTMIGEVIFKMEVTATQFIDLLQEPAK